MKRYKAREGVVLTSVCGESLLVSAAALRDICPFVTVLNDSSAFLWKELQNGAGVEDLENAVQSEFEIDDPAAVKPVIEGFLRQMLDLNYLTETTDDGPSTGGF